ncbi:MAG: type II secretion system F family protein [Lachnospiraceae bacterium]|nr:type II secretion system F family protein [Lachnospiraceae bacterium]
MKGHREKAFFRLLVPEDKLRNAMELYPGKTRDEVSRLVFMGLKKKLLPGVLVSAVLLLSAAAAGRTAEEEPGMKRPVPGATARKETVFLELEEEWKALDVVISAREYEEKQIEKMFKEAEQYLYQVIAGQNESLQKVTRNLYFPETIPAYGNSIAWSTDAPWYVTADGTVRNEQLTVAEKVNVTAEIRYGSECRYFTTEIMVYPKEYTPQEKLLQEISGNLQKQEEETRTSEYFLLPEMVLGYTLKQEERGGFGVGAFLVLTAVAVPVFLYAGYFSDMDNRRKKRKEQAEGCYTQFVTKLSLLMAAGISVRQVFCRLAGEYGTRQGTEHVLAQELTVVRQELENGYSETVVYENFGRRLGVLSYQRMASLLTRNVSRGIQGMQSLLLQEAKEVMAQERANIKVKGEQAGTKLLLPMMGLLVLVFAILLVPAFRSF